MDLRNRFGLYGSYGLGMASIGFTLPFLPAYLQSEGLSKQAIGVISMVAALVSLLQFPIGIFSDRARTLKPLLILSLTVLAFATLLLREVHEVVWLGVVVIFFAENGICRTLVESLCSAEAARLAAPGKVGSALGALRIWKPVSIIIVAVAGGAIASAYGVGAIIIPLMVIQFLAIFAATLIHEEVAEKNEKPDSEPVDAARTSSKRPNDRVLRLFVVAMVLFHTANSPSGVYLGLFMKEELHASPSPMSYAFVVSMAAWMLVVQPAGRWADRIGRRPLLLVAWSAMALRVGLVAVATNPWQVLAIQTLDGLASGLFSVIAGAWVIDRLADKRRVCESQVIVGTSLVLGSAIGPLLAGLIIEPLGFRGMFAALSGVGFVATAIIILCIPETVMDAQRGHERAADNLVDAKNAVEA